MQNQYEFIEKYKLSGRNKRLAEAACRVLEGNVLSASDGPWHRRCISPGRVWFEGIWNWDTAFISSAVKYWDPSLAAENITAFTDFIKPNGMFPDCIRMAGDSVDYLSKPPVMASAVWKVFEAGGDIDFLKGEYKKLVLNEKFWAENRCDGGLFFYGADFEGENEINVKFESGWDNSVRWDKGCGRCFPVDLNCFMAMTYDSLEKISEVLKDGMSGIWRSKKDRLIALINEKLWDETVGFYMDFDRFDDEFSGVFAPSGFMPLYIGAADGARASRCAEITKDKFFPLMPTVSYDNPEHGTDYWRGPVWLNTAYFAVAGLKRYGFPIADELSDNILSMCEKNLPGIFELYNSKTGEGMRCDHFSWSAAFIIKFVLCGEEKPSL